MTWWVLSGQSNRPAGGARLWGSRSFGPETTFSCRWVRILSITVGSSWMQAITLTAPPQALQVWMSMLNTRLSLCAPAHGAWMAFGWRSLLSPTRCFEFVASAPSGRRHL